MNENESAESGGSQSAEAVALSARDNVGVRALVRGLPVEKGIHLVVSDIVAARSELIRRCIEVSQPFHDVGGAFHHADGKCQEAGLNPDRKSYASYASFSDPDDNGWLLQEVTARLSAYLELNDPRFTREVLAAIHGGTTA